MSIGDDDGRVLPCPSTPLLLFPHENTLPPVVRKSEKSYPQAIALMGVGSLKDNGEGEGTFIADFPS